MKIYFIKNIISEVPFKNGNHDYVKAVMEIDSGDTQKEVTEIFLESTWERVKEQGTYMTFDYDYKEWK